MPPPLLTPRQLNTLLSTGSRIHVWDVRFELSNPQAGQEKYSQGHLPGARHIDLDRVLSAHGDGERMNAGRHPLPTPALWAQRLGELGVGSQDTVVVYDQNLPHMACRAWWMLQWVGHDRVRLLDGGLDAWVAAGLPLSTQSPPTVEVAPPYPVTDALVSRWVGIDEVQRELHSASMTVVDARATPRFLGEVEPLDPVAGHIPGALNHPYALNFEADGRFKPPAQIRKAWEDLLSERPADQLVHQCGSGVSACANLLALHVAGWPVGRLYGGSWSEWCNTPDTPRAKG